MAIPVGVTLMPHHTLDYTPTILYPAMDDLATKLAKYCNDANDDTHREVARAFALVDWVEPEVDPDTPQGKYLECLFQLGKLHGFRTYEELPEGEAEVLALFDDPI